jgi:hypothetical protein
MKRALLIGTCVCVGVAIGLISPVDKLTGSPPSSSQWTVVLKDVIDHSLHDQCMDETNPRYDVAVRRQVGKTEEDGVRIETCAIPSGADVGTWCGDDETLAASSRPASQKTSRIVWLYVAIMVCHVAVCVCMSLL